MLHKSLTLLFTLCLNLFAQGMERSLQKPNASVATLVESCVAALTISLLREEDLDKVCRKLQKFPEELREAVIRKLDSLYRCNLVQFLADFTELEGHSKHIRDIAWRPDGCYVLTAGDEDTVFLWDMRDLTQITSQPLKGHGRAVDKIGWNRNGSLAYARTYNNIIKVWKLGNMNTVASIDLIGHTDTITSVQWSPDGTCLLSSSVDGSIRLWDLHDLEKIRSLTLQGPMNRVNSVSWHPDGHHALSGSRDGTIRLWRLADRSQITSTVLPGHNNQVFTVDWSPDGTTALASYADGTLLLFSMNNLDHITSIELEPQPGVIKELAWRYDSKYFLSAVYGNNHGPATLWDLRNLNVIRSLKLGVDIDEVCRVCWSPCGSFVLNSSGKGTVRFWSLTNFDRMICAMLNVHRDSVVGLAWRPDGKHILAGSLLDHKLILWNVHPCAEASAAQLILILRLMLAPAQQIDSGILVNADTARQLFNDLPSTLKTKLIEALNRKDIPQIKGAAVA